MTGKVILVNGSTDGIGKQTALELTMTGSVILFHGRDENKLKSALSEIRWEGKNDKIECYFADFASLDQVREFADQIKEKHKNLNVLINNAGIYLKKRQLTVDGYESTFQINYLAPFLLTNLILDKLMKNAPARIINVSSTTQTWE